MRKIQSGLILILILVSCKGDPKPTKTDTIQDENKNSLDHNGVIELSRNIHGLWISDSYLKSIETTKSIYLSRKYETKILGFYIDKKNLPTNSAFLEGFTDHEGGYSSPVVYDSTKSKFVNDLSRLSEYPFFPDPFELNLDSDKKLEMYFPKTKIGDRYRKIDSDLQTEMRKLLIARRYRSNPNNSKIKFDPDGKVHNFQNFKYYELAADFGEGIDFDAIVFFKTPEGGNWSDGVIYKFEISSNKLKLQLVKTNWETLEHQISKQKLVLDFE